MLGYTVATAALTLEVERKWLDNLLSHHRLPGVAGGTQGRARVLTRSGLVAVKIVRAATDELGMGIATAVALARNVLADPAASVSVPRGALTLTVDVPAIYRDINAALPDALAAAPRPRRGRPPAKR